MELRSITPQGGEAVALPFGRPRGLNPVVDMIDSSEREEGPGLLNEYVRIEDLVNCTKVVALSALEICI